MPRVNLNRQDILDVVESLNDAILRSASQLKIKRLDALKKRLWDHQIHDEPEQQVEQPEVIKPIKKSKG